MNKIILALLLTFRLLGQELQPQSESNTSSVSIEHISPSDDESFVKKAFIALAVPVVIAGAIVTAIVLTPVWIVKKITE